MKNKLVTGTPVIFLIIVGLFIFVQIFFIPTPDSARNVTSTNVKMTVEFYDQVSRTPIVKTYIAEKYDSFSDSKIAKLKDQVQGKVEGDIPCLKIVDGKNVMNFNH